MQGGLHQYKRPHRLLKQVVLTVTRDSTIGLWRVPLENLSGNQQVGKGLEYSINSAYQMKNIIF